MKRSVILCFFVTVILQVGYPQSHIVKDYEASRAASNWIKQNYPSFPDTVRYLFCFSIKEGRPLMYEIQTDSISLIMSASKACLPVLATYKNIGDRCVLKEYALSKLPCCMMDFIDLYVLQLDMAYQNDDRVLYYENEWDSLLVQQRMEPKSISQVGPLLKSVWSQWLSNDGRDSNAYNYYAPSGTTCNHCVAGCVAVAIGQVMNYWKYPLIVTDMEQFDWCNMPNTLDTSMSSYAKKRDAVAYLLRECGRSVHMDYGCTGSSAFTEDGRDALVQRFRYSEDAHFSRKNWNYTDLQWREKIKRHIDWGFPVIMSGHGSGGHAFVCDGYNSNGMFCFNWGWGDLDLNECFFSIQQLTPRDSNDFTGRQGGIFYIHPPSQSSMCNLSIQLDSFYNSCYTITMYDFPPHRLTPQTATILTSAPSSSPEKFRTIFSGDTAVYRAHREIVLQDGFEAEWGSDFTAEIVPCPACEDPTIGPIHPIFDSLFPLTQTGGDSIDEVGDAAYSHMVDFGISRAEVFPNPTTGELTVVTDGMAEAIVVYNAAGQPVGGWDIASQGETWLTLDLSALPQGTYIVALRTKNGASAARVVRQ